MTKILPTNLVSGHAGAAQNGLVCAAPGSTPSDTIQRQSCSWPASTCEPWPDGSVTEAVVQPRCASTPPGWTRQTDTPPTPLPVPCRGPTPVAENRRNPYEKLAAGLRAAIESGQLPPGELLPTVVELAAEHEVSPGTINRAVALLKAEGLIDVERGKHAIVTTKKDRNSRLIQPRPDLPLGQFRTPCGSSDLRMSRSQRASRNRNPGPRCRTGVRGGSRPGDARRPCHPRRRRCTAREHVAHRPRRCHRYGLRGCCRSCAWIERGTRAHGRSRCLPG